ncbi:malonyl-CoA decarboxylase, mitochondrial-like isoform X2 [Varroa jacobsoni]|nr:malonyl-CoA decarboxylase, mitochondrial-like isoform X2 [Varroa jacobsoni]XP_022694981.1 malonyl-CoA decarboxylase, mitochondrial-like isoform X2 [Varroa jacobsoni]XP_022694982.1 malonyl-CoA decarboxylase, mitochondrial-like isoform X2 [Varroa jacobsoni]
MTQKITASVEQLLRETLDPAKDSRNPQSSEPVRELCKRYQTLNEEAKFGFLKKLAQDFDVDHKQVLTSAQHYIDHVTKDNQEIPSVRLEEKLRIALTPRYMELFQQIGKLEGGVKFLVDLRGHMMDLIAKGGTDTSAVRAMSGQLKDLLSIWFSAGLMKVERITWQSPCQMLQKISEYEAVHPVRGWLDLKRRVGSYRRCFVFCHSSMPSEPVVVLHTALMQHIADSIKDIVRHQKSFESIDTLQTSTSLAASVDDLEDPSQVKAAIFYSITSTQKGLQGIELGKHLIKNAVRNLQAEHPNLSTFSTLSPIPGFRDWLLNGLVQVTRGSRQSPFTPQELQEITDEADVDEALAMVHEMIRSHLWYKNDVLQDRLRKPLMKLCAQYLYQEKHRGLALNGVANFHLKNGAVLWRINWLADTSQRGLMNSCSLMVNYRYFLDQIDQNSVEYCTQGSISISNQVHSLLKTEPIPSSQL